jgi:hypothetical protein
LRRTVKLDPIAEYHIYDVIFRNRLLFRKPHTPSRTHYGYRFEGGTTISPTAAYKGFKGALSEYNGVYSNSMSFDVSTYFNNIYHHDIVSWFAELGANNDDINGLGQLLREINSGRSIDCLPHGLYPTKMIGNDFLRFIDNYHGLRSNKLVRFMDDIYLFSNDPRTIADDFQIIQQLLGEKGLSVNPQKTERESPGHVRLDREIDAAKKALLKRRRLVLTEGYEEDERVVGEVLIKSPLSGAEIRYLDDILSQEKIEEDDAELILTIMREHAQKVEGRLPYIIKSFPNLAKSVYGFCAGVNDKELLASIIQNVVKDGGPLLEFQLFWFGAILEDYLTQTSKASSIISSLFNHRSATSITKAKILEIADVRFGLPELRHEFLVSGQSDWLAWASAVGSRSLQATTRNHKLKYFAKSSPMNRLIASIVLKN